MESGADRSVQLVVMEHGAFKEVVKILEGTQFKERRRNKSPKKGKPSRQVNKIKSRHDSKEATTLLQPFTAAKSPRPF